MMSKESRGNGVLAARAGVGLKAEHARLVAQTLPDMGFFEVHAENYMGQGGPPHRYLTELRAHYALSVHGVGLSIGGAARPDAAHLQRLRTVLTRYEPALFSEHLAWSSHGGAFFNDLLPVPYTDATLARICAHIDEVQTVLGRRMLLENPSTYLAFAASPWPEPEFLAEISRRTGCGLLLDVNNVFVACTNQGWDAAAYLDAFPLPAVAEIHLAGHARQYDAAGRALLIDAHDRRVADAVWALYRRVIAQTGPLPTLVEWDNDVPEWTVLQVEAGLAEAMMAEIRGRVDDRVG